MSFVPSPDLLRQVSACPACESHPDQAARGRDGLCDTHRARWNLEICISESSADSGEEELERIMNTVLASEQSGRAILAAIERQLRALRMVWEAHERGAVHLPEGVAESVRTARLEVPRFLPASAERRHRVPQAS